MKTLLTLLALLNLAVAARSAPADDPRIDFAFVWVNEIIPATVFETNLVYLADHLPNHSMTVRSSPTMGPPVVTWFQIYGEGCYATRHKDYVSTRYNGEPEIFVRTIQDPCPGNALAFVLDPFAVPAPPRVVKPIGGFWSGGRKTYFYALSESHSYECQRSTDGGATWKHYFVSCDWPAEGLIEPGAVGGPCGEAFWFVTELPPNTLMRFVDWSEVSPRPGPFYR